MGAGKSCNVCYFYPRSPCGERQATNSFAHAPPEISIHALLAESDTSNQPEQQGQHDFYPRSPCGERHCIIDIINNIIDHFYPRSPCGERLPSVLHNFQPLQISIHALLAESDFFDAVQVVIVVIFLSTLSLRRATCIIDIINNIINHFYPRSPCGERPSTQCRL